MREGWTNHWRSWLVVMALRLGTKWLLPARVNFCSCCVVEVLVPPRDTELDPVRGDPVSLLAYAGLPLPGLPKFRYIFAVSNVKESSFHDPGRG